MGSIVSFVQRNKEQNTKNVAREALVDRGGIQTLTCSLQDCHALVTSPAQVYCRLTIADFRFEDLWKFEALKSENQSEIGNEKSAMILVAMDGLEPSTSRL